MLSKALNNDLCDEINKLVVNDTITELKDEVKALELENENLIELTTALEDTIDELNGDIEEWKDVIDDKDEEIGRLVEECAEKIHLHSIEGLIGRITRSYNVPYTEIGYNNRIHYWYMKINKYELKDDDDFNDYLTRIIDLFLVWFVDDTHKLSRAIPTEWILDCLKYERFENNKYLINAFKYNDLNHFEKKILYYKLINEIMINKPSVYHEFIVVIKNCN